MNTSILTLLLSMSPLVMETGKTSNIFNYPLKISKPISYETVTLTTYSTTIGQTDSTPHITASGFKIDTTNPKKHRIIAVSRDLKKFKRTNTKQITARKMQMKNARMLNSGVCAYC